MPCKTQEKLAKTNLLAGFTPSHGAAGFKLSSPSILDITAVTAALSVINSTTMERMTDKSQQLTGYLESLLQQTAATSLNGLKGPVPWTLVTPCDPVQRGAMLCLRWHDFERLDRVVKYLRDHDVVLDVRWPDVMRITPVAIYNTFEDVWNAVRVLKAALLHTENGEVEG
jgi:kynureninase